jgi:hypothetical protein
MYHQVKATSLEMSSSWVASSVPSKIGSLL